MAFLRWLPVLVILSIIYNLSSIPNLHLIDESIVPLWMLQYINQYTIKIGQGGFFSYVISLHPDFVLHKIGHIVVFGSLGVSLYFATKKSVMWAIVLAALAAVSDEMHQYFVPGRSSRLGDVILDTVAAMVFIFVIKKLSKRQRK